MVNLDRQNNNLVKLPPEKKSFSGHETFPFRFSWLKKGVDLISKEPEVFQSDDAIVKFGVGKNMVQSIRHWCLATRIAENIQAGSRGLSPTKLGNKLFADSGWDPYMEDDATLWLMHWNLSNNQTRAATWFWAFNRFQEYVFTRASMVDSWLRELQTTGSSNISETTIKRDVDCFIQTYLSDRTGKANPDDVIECPLVGLDLLTAEPESERIRFNIGPKDSLPAEIFAYALLQFWSQRSPDRKALDLRDILRSEGSPAFSFKLDQESIIIYLYKLEELSLGSIVFQETQLVRQVIKQDNLPADPLWILEYYYDHK